MLKPYNPYPVSFLFQYSFSWSIAIQYLPFFRTPCSSKSTLCSLTCLPGSYLRILHLFLSLPEMLCLHFVYRWLLSIIHVSAPMAPLGEVCPDWLTAQQSQFPGCSSLHDWLSFSSSLFLLSNCIIVYLFNFSVSPLKNVFDDRRNFSCWLFCFLGLDLSLAHRMQSINSFWIHKTISIYSFWVWRKKLKTLGNYIECTDFSPLSEL